MKEPLAYRYTIGAWWNPIDDIEAAAGGLWDLASGAATSLAQVATAIGGAFADVASDVWKTTKAAANFIGGLPGINVLVKTFDEATHLLKVILDSPITAICVVALAAVLNVVGLGGPLLAEYAALRLGMDMLVKLEDGDTFTVLDLAKAVATAVGAATGLPANAALSASLAASNVIQKAANGQTITASDIQGLTVATASVAAGASGDSAAVQTVSGVAAASNVVAAGISAKNAQAAMPRTLDPNGATKLPGPVAKHLASRIPAVATKAGAQDKAVTAIQDAQSALVAAARFSTYVAKDYGGPDERTDPIGAFLSALWVNMDALEKGFPLGEGVERLRYLEALANVPVFDAPGPTAPLEPDVYFAYTVALRAAEKRREMKAPGTPMDTLALDVLHALQGRLKIPPFDPPDPRTASHVPVIDTSLAFVTAHLLPSPVTAAPISTAAPLPVRSASPYPPIGLPETPPPYTAPTSSGPKNPARDIGLS